VTRRLIADYAARAKPAPATIGRLESLTEREREVLVLVAAGLSNAEIAARLVVSPLTAKTQVSRAMLKLGARDRAQLVIAAHESGLARPGWGGLSQMVSARYRCGRGALRDGITRQRRHLGERK
jgi:DNA-binding CsgD family transcriptional regulator